MDIIVWTLIAFLSGSIPASVMIGYLAAKTDIRQYGDHNPGATNVLRVMGWGWFIPAVLLDYLKGAVPVGLAWLLGSISGWQIVPVALAPIWGHAYSPWLRFRGGKAVAVTFGIWTGLTLGTGPVLLGLLLLLMFAVFETSGWAVTATILGFGGFVWFYYDSTRPELGIVWLGNLVLLAWKHREELGRLPPIRPWLLGMIERVR